MSLSVNKSICLAVVFYCLFFSTSMTLAAGAKEAKTKSNAGRIEIKGVYLGMSKEEFAEKFGNKFTKAKYGDEDILQDFTIAEWPSKYDVTPEFRDNKLDSFMVFFHSNAFNDVVNAVKAKYPNLKCANSIVGNAMGAKFTQTECYLPDKLGRLTIDRFVNNIETSVLHLVSNKKIQEYSKGSNKKNSDI